jgi:hypothetical protein
MGRFVLCLRTLFVVTDRRLPVRRGFSVRPPSVSLGLTQHADEHRPQ